LATQGNQNPVVTLGFSILGALAVAGNLILFSVTSWTSETSISEDENEELHRRLKILAQRIFWYRMSLMGWVYTYHQNPENPEYQIVDRARKANTPREGLKILIEDLQLDEFFR
jgi:hypothetical protein